MLKKKNDARERRISVLVDDLCHCFVEDEYGYPGDLLSLKDLFDEADLRSIATHLVYFGYFKLEEDEHAETEQK